MSAVPKPRADETLQSGSGMADVWYRWVLAITNRINGAPELPEYTVSGLPSASGTKRLIWVSDAGGGACVAYSTGSAWRRISDDTVVS